MPDCPRNTYKLLFGLTRAVIYHRKRERFFVGISLALGMVLGIIISFVFSDQLPKSLPIEILFALVFFIALFLVKSLIAFSLHCKLKYDFMRLSDLNFDHCGRLKNAPLGDIISRRLDIEEEEPPIKRVLDGICHNKLMLDLGYEKHELLNISFSQRLFAHFFNFREHTIEYPRL